jgi:hypothetical protein
MEDPPKRSFITGEIDIKTLIAFAFGSIFIISILVFTAVVKNPSPTEIWTYRIILALAAAGVAAVLPGFIDIKYKGFVQAGGAIGVFVLILLAFPAPDPTPTPAPAKAETASSEDIVWPTEDPEFAARKYVDLVDNGNSWRPTKTSTRGWACRGTRSRPRTRQDGFRWAPWSIDGRRGLRGRRSCRAGRKAATRS